jgi:hypothetical protein
VCPKLFLEIWEMKVLYHNNALQPVGNFAKVVTLTVPVAGIVELVSFSISLRVQELRYEWLWRPAECDYC